MSELDPAHYENVLPLVREGQIPGYSSYAFSVLEGRQKGHVFADDANHPQSALVINLAAPSLACGTAAEPDGFALFLRELLTRLPEGQVLTLWTASEEWRRVLGGLPAVMRSRTVFAYRPGPASRALEADDGALPNGFRLARLDEALARTLQAALDPWSINIWGGPTGFAQGSVGFCALSGDRISSACTAAFIGDGAAEVSIVTDAGFRRQGLASATCRALIRYCLAHGLRPDWSCSSDNLASAALAESLGFVRREEIKGYLLHLASWKMS